MRLLHRLSGIVVSVGERQSQAANREIAFARLAERLHAMSLTQTPRIATRLGRAALARRRAVKQRRARIKQLRRPVREE